jgi:hypothetical protein
VIAPFFTWRHVGPSQTATYIYAVFPLLHAMQSHLDS